MSPSGIHPNRFTDHQFILRIGWLACLILISILILGLAKSGYYSIVQSIGVRTLLQAESSYSKVEITNPFVCMRSAQNSSEAHAALVNIRDKYLKGVALCLAGERSAGMEMLKLSGRQANADVQFAASRSIESTQAGVDAVAQLGLDDRMVVSVLQNLIALPDIDPYPAIRFLAQRVPNQNETWTTWLQGSSWYEAKNNWHEAINWINEGLVFAPTSVRGSLLVRLGYIYQAQSDLRDYYFALSLYNQAIENGGWINPEDEATAHMFKGEIYRIQKRVHGPDSAINEFETALQIQPGNYWTLLDMGDMYQNDIRDSYMAETYFLQAVDANDRYPFAYLAIGDIYRDRGDIKTAIDWYNKLLDRFPNFQAAIDRIKSLEGS